MGIKHIKRLALDVGNSSIKKAIDYGDKDVTNPQPVIMSSHVYRPQPREMFEPSDQSHKVDYLEGPDALAPLVGTSWIVGDWAEMQGGVATYSQDTKAGVQAKAVLANIPREASVVEEVRLCLPSLDVDELSVAIKQQLEGMHSYRLDGVIKQVQIKRVTVSLEGVDAYRYLAENRLFQFPKGLNGIIDFGGGNMTAMCFRGGTPLVNTREICDGLMAAAANLVSHPVLDNVESKGTNPEISRILAGIEDGSFMYGCTGRLFKREFEDYVYGGSDAEGWLNQSHQKIRTKFKDYLSSKDLSQIAIIGGAAGLFKPLLKSPQKNRVFVPKDPRLVTVRGMLL